MHPHWRSLMKQPRSVRLFGKLIIYLAGADRGDIDHAAASGRRPSSAEERHDDLRTRVEEASWRGVGADYRRVGGGGERAALGGGTITLLGPGRSLSLDAWHDSAWAWLFTVLLAAAGVTVLIGGGWATRQPASWCWPATLLIVLAGDLSLIGSVLWPRNPGTTSATFSGLVLRHPEIGQWLGASLGPGLGFYLNAIAALLATASAVAVLAARWQVTSLREPTRSPSGNDIRRSGAVAAF